ncbi:MAG: hypothetical protein ABIG71_02850 [Candidatus Uhrbacteria bacterium]
MASTDRKVLTINEDGKVLYEHVRFKNTQSKVVDTKCCALSTILSQRSNDTELLPPGCRFFRRSQIGTTYIIEQQPCVRMVEWDTILYRRMHESLREENRLIARKARLSREIAADSLQPRSTISTLLARVFRRKQPTYNIGQRCSPLEPYDLKQHAFALAFPFVVFVIRADISGGLYEPMVFYRNEPLRTIDDVLCVANLPNQHDDYRLCGPIGGGTCAAERTAMTLEVFWGSEWNSDLPRHFLKCAGKHPTLASPHQWERASAQDPLFVTRIPWEAAMTVRLALRLTKTAPDDRAQFQALVERVQNAPKIDW